MDHPNLTKVKARVFDRRDRWPADDDDEEGNANANANGGSSGSGAGAGAGAGTGAGGANAAAAHEGAHSHENAKGLVFGLVQGKPLAAKPTSEHLLRCK